MNTHTDTHTRTQTYTHTLTLHSLISKCRSPVLCATWLFLFVYQKRLRTALLISMPTHPNPHFGRATAVDYIFRMSRAVLLRRACELCAELFGPPGDQKDLLAVHIRWVDKWTEMKLLKIATYVDSIKSLMAHSGVTRRTILLISEDSKAVKELQRLRDPTWVVLSCTTRPQLPQSEKGRLAPCLMYWRWPLLLPRRGSMS